LNIFINKSKKKLKNHNKWGCTFGTIKKPLMNAGAPRWFCNFQTYIGARVVEL
jgi:hypothetical protein